MNKTDERRAAVIEQEARKPGLRGKINAKCCECIFNPVGGGGSWKKQVENCTSYNCPLYSVRPTAKLSVVDSGKGVLKADLDDFSENSLGDTE